MIVRYNSYTEFLAVANEPACFDAVVRNHYGANQWCGSTYKQALNTATNGDESLVSHAQTLLDQLETVDNGENMREWTPSVSGAYPVVPEFLAGHPMCMREPRETENLAPVNIYVCTTIGAALQHEQIIKRGTAILALVLKLQQTRPVELFLTSEVYGATDGDYIQVIPMESKPLSLAHVCNAIAGVPFTRHLTYSVAVAKDGFNGPFGLSFNRLGGWSGDRYVSWISEQLGLSDTDLYIKPGHVRDTLISDPVEWINTQLERFNTR